MKCGNKDCSNIVSEYRKNGELKKHCSIECKHKSRADIIRKNIPEDPAPFCDCGNKITKFKRTEWNIYCSTKCSNESRSIDPGPAPKCAIKMCDNTITKKKNSKWLKYCSSSCRHLGVPERVKSTCLEKYGVVNGSKSIEVKDRIKESFTEKYGEGVTNAMHLQEFKDKIKKTNIEKYGTDKPQLLKEFQQKTKETNLKKFGIENPQQLDSLKKKSKETILEKYGVEHHSKLKETQDKKVKTNLEKYGVKNVMQNTEIFEHNVRRQARTKSYIYPSGKQVFVQGYEPFALAYLLNSYTEDEIIVGKGYMPALTYFADRVFRRYFPDIYIPKDNLIIEVKSKWTLNTNRPRNMAKRQACLNAGYNFKFMIFDKDGNLLDIGNDK